ncbi:hypothetical protein BKA70DRAFT_1128812 [Coprinopsis sp. MPI-PUGE-AT-0042]|nr:hypothetical protein BKA70DRAFT_1128812 [Coprinopsis sp. MPI-PUGE-AT-0042]
MPVADTHISSVPGPSTLPLPLPQPDLLLPARPSVCEEAPLVYYDPATGDDSVESNLSFDPTVSGDSFSIPRTYRNRVELVHNHLKALAEDDISPTELLSTMLDPSHLIFNNWQRHFYAATNHDRLLKILGLVRTNKATKTMFAEWLVPLALEWVSSTISQEMEIAKPMLRMRTTEITTGYTSEWDGTKVMESVAAVTPTLTEVLRAATASSDGDEKSKKDRVTARHLIASQLHYVRSRSSARVALGIGIVTWSGGASRQLLALMNKVGLSPSYQSVQNAVDTLAERSVEQGRAIADEPHALAYDNFQTSTSDFVEQTLKATPKVQHGTFPVIYKLPRPVKEEDVAIGPILERMKQARLLELSDLRPSRESVRSYSQQTTVNIAKVLLKYVPGFASLKDSPLLQNAPRRPLPKGQKNVFAPLRVTTIEEASYSGNRLMTNSRNRGLKIRLKKDVNDWERRAIFQLGPAPFHVSLNKVWSLKVIHWGEMSESGSLSNLSTQLNKTRLASAKPDYHTLETFLSQVLDGLLLDACELECGYPTLEKYADSKPSAEDLLQLALRVRNKYAVPTPDYSPIQKPKDPDAGASTDDHDPVFENTKRLTRDLLLLRELNAAIRDGDFGRIEDILIDLALFFRGAGANNYATELLHFIYHLKLVWCKGWI